MPITYQNFQLRLVKSVTETWWNLASAIQRTTQKAIQPEGAAKIAYFPLDSRTK